MLVELGNPHPVHSPGGERESLPGPAVTRVWIPDEFTVTDDLDVNDLARHLLATSGSGVTNQPGHEALLAVIHQAGTWSNHGDEPPLWVWSDNPVLAKQLAAFYDCTNGRPGNVEDTHYTRFGPPGVGPTTSEEPVDGQG